jgi:HSP20 family molecular chaperone IbpA
MSANKKLWRLTMKWGITTKRNADNYDMFADSFDTMIDNFLNSGSVRNYGPACDIEETDKAYLVHTELPGLEEKDIDVSLANGVLVISGEKKDERHEENANRVISERRYGSFQRSFKLPSSVKTDQVKASYKKGVLTIEIPKAEEAKPKQIKVEIGN